MIPLKLELKNFLSYGNTVVKADFADHTLICLSGKNGNGKSALLDAITWAIWGQARKVAGSGKADAGLLRLGQTRMIVSIEFLCNGQKYRVRREYAKTHGKPHAALDFNLFDSAGKSFVSLSENTVRKTQLKIEKVIGLDFETFVNSVFLRQGQSNEFSKKTPKERKQILGNILNLSSYDDLARRALEHGRAHTDEAKLLSKMQEAVREELEKEPEVEKNIKEKEGALKDVEKTIREVTSKVEKKEKEKVALLQKKYQVEQCDAEEKKRAELFEKKKKMLLEVVAMWREVHKASLAAPNVNVLEKEKKELLAQEKALRGTQQKELLLQEKIVAKKEAHQKRLMACKKTYQEKLHKKMLAHRQAQLEQKQLAQELTQKTKQCDERKKKQEEMAKQLRTIEKELDGYKAFAQEFETVRAQFEKRRVFYQQLVQRGNWAQNELKELDRKKELVEDKKNPSCPLCEQVLTVRRKQFLGRTFVKQEQFLQHRLARVATLLKTLKRLLLEQHTDVKKRSLQDDRYKQFQINKETFIKNRQELEVEQKRAAIEIDLLTVRVRKATQDLDVLEKELVATQREEKAVGREDVQVKKLYDALVALQKRRDALAYDKPLHEKLLRNLQACEKKLAKLETVQRQQAEQGERRRNVARLCAELKELKQQAIVIKEKRTAIVGTGFGEKELDAALAALKKEKQSCVEKKEKLLQERGSLLTKRERFAALKKEKEKRDNAIEQARERAKEYAALAGMFGKDGIQALLIEQAIPEIEYEANRLLAKLTDNKSQVFIESLRDLKKGGVKESLDIHISDSNGIRPYEMFSGGEAFRIDFALRIAISKLLARRAGTALQTLIVDEGFGSQDEEGLTSLMDVIYAIKKDFAKVIVVSHLPSFKDNFPVHFVVEKDSLGSFIRVEERG